MKKRKRNISQTKINEKNLEEKIIRNIYTFEAKRTYRKIFFFAFIIVALAILISFLANLAYEILRDQQTLDLLKLFGEDTEIIRENIGNVIDTFWQESPQTLLFLLFFFIMAFLTTLYLIAVNFKKIKNRIISAKKYFKTLNKNG